MSGIRLANGAALNGGVNLFQMRPARPNQSSGFPIFSNPSGVPRPAYYTRRMTPRLRPARGDELADLSALCLRSKAYWGYDAEFMAACIEELTLSEQDFANDPIAVLEDSNGIGGVAHVCVDAEACYLDKLFIDPDRIGRGYGRKLYLWALDAARALGARELVIEADPDAAPFYQRMGSLRTGEILSGSIAGRVLPRFVHTL